MKTFKLLYIAMAVVGLLLLSGTVNANSLAHFGFIEAIEGSPGDAKEINIVRVSSKKYFLNRNKVDVFYKGVPIELTDLKKGMKVKFFTTGSGTGAKNIKTIVILSNHDSLINH